MIKKFLKSLFCGFLASFVFLTGTVLAQSEIILENDFEKGTQNWENRGTASVSSSKDQAASGIKSLKVSGRSANWQGAQLNLTKLTVGGKIYKFTVSIKLAKNEKPDTIKMTMQRGDSNFDGVGAATVNADDWTTISGNFKPSGKDAYLLIYIEAERTNTAYFIDNFKIESLGDEIPKQTGVILQNDFEDMTAQNWFARGENVQMFSSNAGGSQSLKVAGRTQKWHGLQLDVSPIFFKSRTYEISVKVRLVKGQAKDNLVVTMQQTPPKGEIQYVNIIQPTAVTDAEWITLTGQYKATTNDNNLVIYVEADSPTTSFFIDNFSVKIP